MHNIFLFVLCQFLIDLFRLLSFFNCNSWISRSSTLLRQKNMLYVFYKSYSIFSTLIIVISSLALLQLQHAVTGFWQLHIGARRDWLCLCNGGPYIHTTIITHGFKHFQHYSELRILISLWKPIDAINQDSEFVENSKKMLPVSNIRFAVDMLKIIFS